VANLVEIPRPREPYEQLNPQQRAGVEHGERPLLVVAAWARVRALTITDVFSLKPGALLACSIGRAGG